MKIRTTLNRHDLSKVLEGVGVRGHVKGVKVRRDGRFIYDVRLFPIGEKYRRIGRSGRRVNAVCFHGHYAFLEALLKKDPAAEVSSAMLPRRRFYTVKEVLRDHAENIAYTNVGSIYYPAYYVYLCDCK